MSSLMRWLVARRGTRIAALLLSFLLPLTNVLGAALVVMSTRKAGWRSAAIDLAVGLALLGGLVQFTGGDSEQASGILPVITALLGAGALWGGALAGALLLRRFESVDLAVQSLVVLALLGLLAISLMIPDPRAHWQPVLESLIRAAGLPQVDGLPAGWLGTVASLMHGVIGASLLSTLILALILGLWFERDASAGEWRRRFLELRLGRVLSLLALLAAVLTLTGSIGFGGGALLVLATGFAAQGVAVVHWTADRRGWPRVWPLALYGPLLLGAPAAGLLLASLALAGLLDNGIALRRPGSNVV
ncbi:MAG: hypothetical protein ABI661_00500 [Gammaproteobacteria bacterium]